jgi:hypothetical protein
MELKTQYAFGKTVQMPYLEAERRVREELLKEGFGVLTEMNVRKKFAEKLQKEFRHRLRPDLPGSRPGDDVRRDRLNDAVENHYSSFVLYGTVMEGKEKDDFFL